jgi:glycyl-tRNA synthetase
MWDKTQRIVVLTKQLSNTLNLNAEESKVAERAAQLSKADLATKMVVEMTSLQGVMGKHYALDSGEPAAVAEAIFEHYMPRFAGDVTPKSKPGFVVGLADRLDSLTGLFAMGLEPTGAKDPFAQRRAAIGIVQSLMAHDQEFDLREGIAQAAAVQQVVVSEESKAKTVDFILQRLRALLLEAGHRYDVIDAILAKHGHNPAVAMRGITNLMEYVNSPGWSQVLAAFSRCVRITRDLKDVYKVDEEILNGLDKDLLTIIRQAEVNLGDEKSIDFFFKAFLPMVNAITNYFNEVLIMSDVEVERRNRLGLVQRIVRLGDEVADFSKLEGF